MQFTIHNLEDWETITDAIVPAIKHPILLLNGNLGAGKTTFTQFLLKKLGSTDEVSSPTYAIVNEYHTPQGNVFHFDLYRMKSAEEVHDIGMEEYLDHAFLCIIEWPEVFWDELKDLPHHEMNIEYNGTSRMINFR